MISTRNINITSDCGKYTISAQLLSESTCYSQDNMSGKKCYVGSVWVVTMRYMGKIVNNIKGFHFGKYCCGLCQYDAPLNKNTILYLAHLTGIFTKALDGVDIEKVTREWTKGYVKARLNFLNK